MRRAITRGTAMRISEIFHSIQGEGSLTGVPSVFVRTSGCNLRCTWCDTPYASWRPEGADQSIDAVCAEVLRHGSRHVVLTGGEPMIAKDVRILAARLKAAGRHITIETAATIAPAGVAFDLASLSPKLANSTPADDDPRGTGWRERHERLRHQPGIVREWIEAAAEGGRDYQLKFVVSAEPDLAEIETLLGEIGPAADRSRVFLMPEGVTLEALRSRSEWLVRACLERGFRYAHRLHIELFGNTRGT
ncbi:MAG: 7-carboxy-7-deazaguanine synthase QueE [Opitutaceae bacterium]